MKIKQVEELVGITRKNIRFYEEQYGTVTILPSIQAAADRFPVHV